MEMEELRTVILGLLGPSLDNGKGPERWERWRPSVSLCQHVYEVIQIFGLSASSGQSIK